MSTLHTTANSFKGVVGDVGGTNARFALVTEQNEIVQAQTLPCADYVDLAAALGAYLQGQGSPSIQSASIAVATAVLGDAILFTNSHWAFSIEATRQQLGLEKLVLLNDFTALALSLPHLRADELESIGGGEAVANAPLALIGPGTGLGVSGMIPDGRGDWIPLQSEGGHVTLAASNARELAILAELQNQYPHVSAERVLSGLGLPSLYYAVANLHGARASHLQPAEIAERGVQNACPVCYEVMHVFCAMLGTVAANLAITLGARGGVYIGGGIVPKLGGFFEKSAFRARFNAKGRFSDYQAAIPVWVIHSPYPALIGAAQRL